MRKKITLPILATTFLLSGCYSQMQVASHWIKKNANKASGGCTSEGYMKTGNPYKIFGIKYYPKKTSYKYDETGVASWYGKDFHGKASANGECYDMYAMTAAHKTLPLPTTVRVTNLKNGRSVVLKVNDRGPYAHNRIIDLSYAAAKKLDMDRDGIQKVRVQAIGGPYHHPNGADSKTAQASRNASPSERRRIHDRASHTTTPPAVSVATHNNTSSNRYSLTDRALGSVRASFNKAKQVTIGGVNINANINESVSLKDIKDALPNGSFTDRVSSKTQKKSPQEPISNSPEHKEVQKEISLKERISLQFGSYSQHANAMQKWQATTDIFPQSQLKTVSINGKPMHRIRTGPFKNQADATAALEKARAAGFNDTVIVLE